METISKHFPSLPLPHDKDMGPNLALAAERVGYLRGNLPEVILASIQNNIISPTRTCQTMETRGIWEWPPEEKCVQKLPCSGVFGA